ncbi:helix-turn-helix domain-containing protein [Streptomyces sp. NPDC020379]|uniref:helix-turn-helix domain-containing protein n=1 Tax=Streptomyces sp. NPDC020379 TaxID=3365071 RepID=UPI0037B05CEB
MESAPSSALQEARVALGGRLREIRRAGGFKTARAFATRAGWSESKASRIENGITQPSENDLRQYADLCQVPDMYSDLAATAHNIDEMYVEWRLHRDGLRPVQESHVPLYDRTRHFRIYEPGVIPGLLQTPAYARSIMSRIIGFWGIPDDTEDAVAVRMSRQQVLRDAHRRFGILMEETALRSRFGDAEVMATQLGHFLAVSVLQQVSLGIVPMTADRTMWPLEGFWIYDDNQVVIELATAQVTVKQPSEIATYTRMFSELTQIAVFGKSARALITEAVNVLE